MIQKVLTFSDSIHAVHATAAGLWIGHSGGLTGFDPRTGWMHKWTTLDGLPALPVLHVATNGDRLALATPNGVAWSDDVPALVRETADGEPRLRWQRGLMHPMGAGAYVNGVAFVEGKIYAATGGGRMYREAGSGFELIELPLRQARLVRLYELPSAKRTLRLLLVTNNSGVLLLATGAEEEPSLYQWSEEEGLCSRYVTAMAAVGEFVAVAVHGCVHVTTQRRLVSEPDELVHWGKVQWGEGSGAADHNRAAALCEHAGHLYIGTSAGLYRVPMARLEAAERETVVAERVDDAPVRHLVSCQGELWAVQLGGLGRYVDPAAPAPARVEPQEVEGRLGGLRSRLLGRRHAGRAPETHEEMPAPGGC